ncbi:MAG TPA: zinc-ribbon domain-containing protein [Chloroflexaceae bacterium]|nr:zinc-ribbon domain-containing protein [Chloroflexaceae bacterium]
MHCQSCGADLPDDARFCIECGADVGAAPASTGPTVHLPRNPEAAVACRACGATNPDFAAFCVRCGQPIGAPAPASAGPMGPQSLARRAAPPQRAYRGRHRPARGWEGISGALFLIGLGALFLLKLPFWPGILVVIGIVAFTAEALRGRPLEGMGTVIWMFGLAVMFTVPRLWWPGILVLVGLSVLLEMIKSAARRP